MATYFATSATKLAFELSAQEKDYVYFAQLSSYASTDAELVESVKLCDQLGITVRNLPNWVANATLALARG